MRKDPYQFYTEMREKHKEKRILAELGLRMHACCASEINCERVLGYVARLVCKDRVSLNNASIMALFMYYLKKK
jgi:hypothetical protein